MADIVETIVGTVGSILIGSRRSIGGIVPNIVVEEVSRDTTFITNHPVERGAAISDHAFMMPAEVEIRCAWSDSTGGFQGYSKLIYAALQRLQIARQPFTVLTGKRWYSNMLIAGLEVTTNNTAEYALLVRVFCREVIIVSTQTVSAGTASGTGSPGTQSQPQRTSSTGNAGNVQVRETGAVPAVPAVTNGVGAA